MRTFLCWMLLLCTSPVWADDPLLLNPQPQSSGVLTLIPENAFLMIGMENLEQLAKKGDALFEKHKVNMGLRPTALMHFLLQNWGLHKGIDFQGSVAIMCVNPHNETPDDIKQQDWQERLVFAVSVADWKRIAEPFGLKEADLLEKQAVAADWKRMGRDGFLYRRGKHLFLGVNKEAVVHAATHASMADVLNQSQAARLQEADIFVAMGKALWHKAIIEQLQGDVAQVVSDEKVLEGLRGLVEFTKFGLLTFQLDDGLRVRLTNVFDKERPAAVADFLTTLAAGPGTSDLVGLPKRQPLFATAAKGEGTDNVSIARGVTRLALLKVDQGGINIPADKLKPISQAFSTVWSQLNGSRVAVYAKPTESGPKLTAVAILDLDDPLKFLNILPEITDVAEETVLQAGTPNTPWTHRPNAENIAGARVDWMVADTSKTPQERAKILTATLGEQWNRVKLAVVGKQLILHIGYEVELLEETISNLQQNKVGLAELPSMVQALQRLEPDRKVEMHAALEQFMRLGMSEALNPEETELMSAALMISSEQIEIQAFLPEPILAELLNRGF